MKVGYGCNFMGEVRIITDLEVEEYKRIRERRATKQNHCLCVCV